MGDRLEGCTQDIDLSRLAVADELGGWTMDDTRSRTPFGHWNWHQKVASDSVIVLIAGAGQHLSGVHDVWEACEEPATCMGLSLVKRIGAFLSRRKQVLALDPCPIMPVPPMPQVRYPASKWLASGKGRNEMSLIVDELPNERQVTDEMRAIAGIQSTTSLRIWFIHSRPHLFIKSIVYL